MEISGNKYQGEHFRFLVGVIIFIFGISVANVLRGWYELFFYALLFVVFVVFKVKVPVVYATTMLAGLLVLLNPFGRDVQLSSVIYFIGPAVEGMLIASGLYYLCKVNTFEKLNCIVIIFVVFQLLSVVIMFFFPDFRNSLLLFLFIDDMHLGSGFSNAFSFRGYGISRHFLFGFPLAVALLFSYILYSERVSLTTKVIVFFMAILICAVNARTGLLIILIALGFYMISSVNGVKILMSCIMAISLSIPLLNGVIDGDVEKYVEWLTDSLTLFTDIQDNGTVNDLATMVKLPDGIYSLFFGDGEVLNPGNINYSDIGYIRGIFDGGVLFVTVVLALYYVACRDISRANVGIRSPLDGSIFLFVIYLCFIIAMIKGDAYSISDYSRSIFVLAFISRFITRMSRSWREYVSVTI